MCYCKLYVLLLIKTVSLQYDIFVLSYSPYLAPLHEHAPLVEKRVNTLWQTPWFKDNIAKAIQEMDSLTQHANKIKNEATLQLYKRTRNDTTHLIRKAKQYFYTQFFNDDINNPKSFGTKTSPPQPQLHQGPALTK